MCIVDIALLKASLFNPNGKFQIGTNWHTLSHLFLETFSQNLKKLSILFQFPRYFFPKMKIKQNPYYYFTLNKCY